MSYPLFVPVKALGIVSHWNGLVIPRNYCLHLIFKSRLCQHQLQPVCMHIHVYTRTVYSINLLSNAIHVLDVYNYQIWYWSGGVTRTKPYQDLTRVIQDWQKQEIMSNLQKAAAGLTQVGGAGSV